MGFEAESPGAIGVQIEKTAPWVGKYLSPVVAGDVPQEQGHRDSDGRRLDQLASLIRSTGEVPGLRPR